MEQKGIPELLKNCGKCSPALQGSLGSVGTSVGSTFAGYKPQEAAAPQWKDSADPGVASELE